MPCILGHVTKTRIFFSGSIRRFFLDFINIPTTSEPLMDFMMDFIEIPFGSIGRGSEFRHTTKALASSLFETCSFDCSLSNVHAYSFADTTSPVIIMNHSASPKVQPGLESLFQPLQFQGLTVPYNLPYGDQSDGSLPDPNLGLLDTEPKLESSATPMKEPEVNLPSSGKAIVINLCMSKQDDTYEYVEESPSKTPGSHKEGLMRLLSVSYTFYLLKGTEITKGTSSKKKPVYSSIPLPTTKVLFDMSSDKFTALKMQLFMLSSEINKSDDDAKGNAAILKAADACNKVVITAFIVKHDTYGKGLKRALSSDHDVGRFYAAVKGSPGADAGFTIVMENPAKAAQEAANSLTKKQGQLRAQNSIDNVATTSTALARLTPIEPHKEWLQALQLHLGLFKNHNNEGWRVFNPDDLSQKMELTFKNLIEWSRELAAGTPGVTLKKPPVHPDFVWKDMERPPPLASPVPDVKRAKVEEKAPAFPLGSYAEMQGTNINVDYDFIRRIYPQMTLFDYLNFCDFGHATIAEITKILLANGITSFHQFLFPAVLNAEIIATWGISWGNAMELMTHPRRFYQEAQLADDIPSKGKGKAINQEL
ncbi:uncharacterized protein MELLADRAFT_58929 [Melampsora larici-populina 98AG31]|uniref:Uncharacterized protein n=1 Tax=Melampsora larici-populina (strain 98AG31 / pathotype 3-4-7) TaxID=747676 RepID=F4R6F9_MELLP|nr:uncharacterized protein MELLADRAFT_58929 [Melampsora larici-populina 98AG31]EGG11871.1 hypothetical protein MELLADRAFT_58929 [Melampsora larici-populina 98AG31]